MPLCIDAEAEKKRLQVRIVGQEKDNSIILTWIDIGPNSRVSIQLRISIICTVSVKRRLQTGGKMQTEGKISCLDCGIY